MKTKKHCERDWELIDRHHRNAHIKDNGHKLPDIGWEYRQLLEEALRKPSWECAYGNVLAFYNSDEWCGKSEWAASYRLRTLALQRMRLVDSKFKLTKLGHHYLTHFDAHRSGRPRPQK